MLLHLASSVRGKAARGVAANGCSVGGGVAVASLCRKSGLRNSATPAHAGFHGLSMLEFEAVTSHFLMIDDEHSLLHVGGKTLTCWNIHRQIISRGRFRGEDCTQRPSRV